MPKRTAKHLTTHDIKKAVARDAKWDLPDAGVTGLVVCVHPSGAKTWTVKYTPPTGKKTRKKLGNAETMTVGRARVLASKTLTAISEGHDPHGDAKRAKHRTFGKYVEGAYKEYAESHITTHRPTLAGLKRNFSHLFDRGMAEITELDVQRWRNKKAKEDQPVSFATLQRDFTALKACLNTAVKVHKIIPAHQLVNYSLKRDLMQARAATTPPPRYLSKDEAKALRAALEAREQRLRDERDRMRQWERERDRALSPAIQSDQYADYLKPMVLLALNTGLRRGDLFTLDWGHVDLVQKQIRKVINKTSRKNTSGTPAVLPLSPEAVKLLQQWKKQGTGKGLVFPSPATGQSFDNINKSFNKLIEDSGIKNFSFHCLRHTFASWLVMEGVPLNTVRDMMTHADIKMTLVYAHLSSDHKAEALAKVFG